MSRFLGLASLSRYTEEVALARIFFLPHLNVDITLLAEHCAAASFEVWGTLNPKLFPWEKHSSETQGRLVKEALRILNGEQVVPSYEESPRQFIACLLIPEMAQTVMATEARRVAHGLNPSRPKWGQQIPWGPPPKSVEAYAFDEKDPQAVAIRTAQMAIDRNMPQIEKAFKYATKVRYKFRNATTQGKEQVFFYISPPFRTDYIVMTLTVKKPDDLRLSMAWIPFEPGTQTVDFKNMISIKAHPTKIPFMMGIYAVQLAHKMARTMPNLLGQTSA